MSSADGSEMQVQASINDRHFNSTNGDSKSRHDLNIFGGQNFVRNIQGSQDMRCTKIMMAFQYAAFHRAARGVLHPTNNLNIAVPQREGKIHNLTKLLRVLCFCLCGGVNQNRRFTRSNLSSILRNFETTRAKMMDLVSSREQGVWGNCPIGAFCP